MWTLPRQEVRRCQANKKPSLRNGTIAFVDVVSLCCSPCRKRKAPAFSKIAARQWIGEPGVSSEDCSSHLLGVLESVPCCQLPSSVWTEALHHRMAATPPGVAVSTFLSSEKETQMKWAGKQNIRCPGKTFLQGSSMRFEAS